MLKDLVLKNRSYRRFYEEKEISMETLESLVELARLTPSGGNTQSGRFVLINDRACNALVYKNIKWAGYYQDWNGPIEGERPSAYIIMLSPEGKNLANDDGIKGQTMLLGAAELGLGGCFIGNVERTSLKNDLKLPEGYTVSLVIALGYPKEEVELRTITSSDDIKYYREGELQCVPKIVAEDLILRKN